MKIGYPFPCTKGESDVMHNRLRAIRKALRLSQKHFAEQIGLNQNSLSMIEKNHTPVTEKNVKLICTTFNINEQWLRTGFGEMFCSSPYEKRLRDICMSLTLENQESLLLIAQELLKIQSRVLIFPDEGHENVTARNN
jgi:transcriptional regulator with XRE-family HTH domain